MELCRLHNFFTAPVYCRSVLVQSLSEFGLHDTGFLDLCSKRI